MNDSGEWGNSCTRICCTLSSFRLMKLYISASIPRVVVRAPLPITKISSRAIRTSPPSIVNLRVGSFVVFKLRVRVLNPGVKSKIDCMITASRSRTAFAMRPMSTSLYMLMDASRVKKKLCNGRRSYQSLFRNLVNVSRFISTPSMSKRAKSSASSSNNLSLIEPLGVSSAIKGSIFSMRLSTSNLMASSFKMFVSKSLT